MHVYEQEHGKKTGRDLNWKRWLWANYCCWPAAAAAAQITGLCNLKKDKEKTAAEVTNMLVDWPLHNLKGRVRSSLPWEFL